MKKKNIAIGVGATVAAAAAGYVAYKNRDKIKGKVDEIKCKVKDKKNCKAKETKADK